LVYIKGLGYPFCIPLNLISFFVDKIKNIKELIEKLKVESPNIQLYQREAIVFQQEKPNHSKSAG